MCAGNRNRSASSCCSGSSHGQAAVHACVPAASGPAARARLAARLAQRCRRLGRTAALPASALQLPAGCQPPATGCRQAGGDSAGQAKWGCGRLGRGGTPCTTPCTPCNKCSARRAGRQQQAGAPGRTMLPAPAAPARPRRLAPAGRRASWRAASGGPLQLQVAQSRALATPRCRPLQAKQQGTGCRGKVHQSRWSRILTTLQAAHGCTSWPANQPQHRHCSTCPLTSAERPAKNGRQQAQRRQAHAAVGARGSCGGRLAGRGQPVLQQAVQVGRFQRLPALLVYLPAWCRRTEAQSDAGCGMGCGAVQRW